MPNSLQCYYVLRHGPTGMCSSLAHGDHSNVCMSLSLRSAKRLLLTNDAQIWVPEEPWAYGGKFFSAKILFRKSLV